MFSRNDRLETIVRLLRAPGANLLGDIGGEMARLGRITHLIAAGLFRRPVRHHRLLKR
ncbi:MAG: hypothetical protein RL417_723 [Pseudomonadota bacterium]|jgi:hypothetical protein